MPGKVILVRVVSMTNRPAAVAPPFVAVRFLPCGQQPRDSVIAFEDWSEIQAQDHRDEAYLIVPMAAATRRRPCDQPGQVELRPWNPFAVVMMILDRQGAGRTYFHPASSDPFCTEVVKALRVTQRDSRA